MMMKNATPIAGPVVATPVGPIAKSPAPSVVAAKKQPILKVGDAVKENKYEIVKILGQGGFGAVFKVKDKKTGEMYALKLELEPPKGDMPGLDLEEAVLKRMQFNSHFVRFVDSGKYGQMAFLVMQLIGCNLAELRKGCPQFKLTENSSVRLAAQCLDCLEAIHAAGLLHRDIKPANFALGRLITDYRIVYMLDFGLVRRYREKNGQVRKMRPIVGFRGTLRYASVNCHMNVDLGRVDDLWGWMFMVIEFLRGELPWNREVDQLKIRNLKSITKKTLCRGLGPELETIYGHFDNLKYADQPPYHFYRQKLMEVMQRKHYEPNDPYDWEEKGVYFEQLKNIAPFPPKQVSKRKVVQPLSKHESSEDSEDEST